MKTTRLLNKGQVTIPKAIRDTRGWDSGLALSVEETDEGILLRPLFAYPKTTASDLLGCTSYTGRKKSLAEMRGAVAKRAKASG